MDPDLPIHQTPNLAPDSVVPTEPKKTFPFKWAMIILIIVFIIVVPTVYFLGQQSALKVSKEKAQKAKIITVSPAPASSTTSETANWKTYTSKYFLIKYPTQWTYQTYDNFYVNSEQMLEIKPPKPSGIDKNFDINWLPNIKIWDSKYLLTKDGTPTEITIGNFKALKYNLTEGLEGDGCGCKAEKIVIKNNDLYFIFAVYGKTSVTSNQEEIPADLKDAFEKMITTLNFTDETASWNTYKSVSESTLFFKYPTSWVAQKTVNANSEAVTFTSENGTEIIYSTGGNYHGGACSDQTTDIVNQITPLSKAKGLNLIDISISLKSGSEEKMGIDASSPKVGNISNCSEPPLIFSSKTNSNKQIIFSTVGKINENDKQEVNQILESLNY
jgi:hypothetical protein